MEAERRGAKACPSNRSKTGSDHASMDVCMYVPMYVCMTLCYVCTQIYMHVSYDFSELTALQERKRCRKAES